MNRLHVYTGPGKGKTTAAMGLAVRSLGHGNRVLVGQFLKDGRSGELISLEKCGAKVCVCPPFHGFVCQLTEQRRQEAVAVLEQYVQELRNCVAEYRPQTVILDELGMAVKLKMVSEQSARALLDEALECAETVATGYEVADWMLEKASYITCMQVVRHPFVTENQPAREGVEW